MNRIHGYTMIRTDPENAAVRFWEEDVNLADCPREITQGMIREWRDRIIVRDSTARLIEDWCHRQKHFSEGPAYAHDALLFEQIGTVPTEAPAAWKFADPTEDARWVYNEVEAQEIAAEDPSLIVEVIY